MRKMHGKTRVLIFALLIFAASALPATAAEETAPSYGMFDMTGTMNAPDVENINSLLRLVYEQNGLSIYLMYAKPIEGNRNDFLNGFLNQNVFPNPGVFDKGVSVVYDGRGYGSVPFAKDRSGDAIYPPEYLGRMIPAVIKSTRESHFELFESLVFELRARANEYKAGTENALAASGGPVPDKLEAPNYVNVQVMSNNAGRRYLATRFEMPESVAALNGNVDIVVSVNLDWKINDGPWSTDLTGSVKTAFAPTRANARLAVLFSNFYSEGDWGNIDVENNVYSFRAFFDFVTPDGKRVISPFTDVIALTAKK
ncbi:MAG: hypothetical protein LBU26_05705 [Synergistaceae bacterium]|nr:hypothetical protein [Synergistaceae bacterium]